MGKKAKQQKYEYAQERKMAQDAARDNAGAWLLHTTKAEKMTPSAPDRAHNPKRVPMLHPGGGANPANWMNEDDNKSAKPVKITSDFTAPDYADHYEERNT